MYIWVQVFQWILDVMCCSNHTGIGPGVGPTQTHGNKFLRKSTQCHGICCYPPNHRTFTIRNATIFASWFLHMTSYLQEWHWLLYQLNANCISCVCSYSSYIKRIAELSILYCKIIFYLYGILIAVFIFLFLLWL